MKALLKELLIPPFASRFVSSLATGIFGQGVPVFLLHRMSSAQPSGQAYSHGTSATHLRRCLQYLVDSDYTFISLEQLVTAIKEGTPLPERAVAFTMDDGFIDQAEIAAPIFLEYDCPLTFFVISGLLDQQLWPWDSQSSWIINNTKKSRLTLDFPDETLHIEIDDSNRRHNARELTRNYLKEVDATLIPALLEQLADDAGLVLPETPPDQCIAMDWNKARELEQKGIQFAPHSVTHRILSKLDRENAEKEILDSWHTLQRELENPLNLFCYPTGRILDFGPREVEILKNNGFIGAVSTIPGHIEPGKNALKRLYHLPRFELPNTMTDFIQYCSWIEHAKHADSSN